MSINISTSISASTNLSSNYTYLRIHTEDTAATSGGELAFRKLIQDALQQTFGASAAATHVDVLRLRSGGSPLADTDDQGETTEEGSDVVIRVVREDAPRIKVALTSAPTRLSVVDESHFLPALLASSPSD